MGNDFFLHELHKPSGHDIAPARPPTKKISPDKTTPFARCISHGAASAVGCGESCQLLLSEQASPKFIIIGYLSLTNLLDTHFFYTLFFKYDKFVN